MADLSGTANDDPSPGEPSEPLLMDQSLNAEFSLNEFGETVSYDSRFGTKSDQSVGNESPDTLDMPETIGRYEIQELLGRGGFGAVFRAIDTVMERSVALKLPLLQRTTTDDSSGLAEAFLNEARKLAQLSHAGIVAVHDIGVHDGLCFIVSDFLDGQDLNHWLIDHTPHWTETVEIIAGVADALAYIHSQRTVHRDIKPANILLVDQAGRVQPVLVDFGLAISDSASGAPRGVISGTPNYMSPEQARGEAHRIDGRTDIYSLGVILYRMLTGTLPFQADEVTELLRQVMQDEPQPPRGLRHDIPRELESICLKAMAKEIDDRYTTAADLSADLRRVLQQHKSAQEAEAAKGKNEDERSEAVRRQVTVLYCENDLFESSGFQENLDPEEQHAVLVEYQKLCERAVEAVGGTIVQFTGQELLVCYGYPTAFEDAARRAVSTGLSLLQAYSELNAQLADRHGIGGEVLVGIHSGPAILQEAGTGKALSLSIMGEARNVATRLQSVAQPDAVIVTDATHRLIAGYYDCNSLGRRSIRGTTGELEIYRVVGESTARSRIDVAEPVGLTPLIGRDSELAMLIDLWEQAEEDMGQIVCVIGEAGLGKSRLVHEIKQHVIDEQGPQTHSVVEWRCSPFFQNTGLYPAIDYFERTLQIDREDSAANRLDKLVAHLDDYKLADAETVALFASLLSIPTDDRFQPLNLAPIRQKEKTLQALLKWFAERAKSQPVLFVVEDLHWIDPTSLNLLETLVSARPESRVLTLFTFRPEFETPWGSREFQTQIALNRLTRDQIEEMMRKRLELSEIPTALVEQVIDRTEGVPLFIEEFSNMIHESGALEEVDGHVKLNENFELKAIPATLRDLLVSRLDRMESNHEVTQLGATIGREFTYELMQAVTTLDAADLQDELAKLVHAELIYQRGTPPQATYTFKHALIQDAAYDSMLNKQRQQFHGSIAGTLEERFPEVVENEPELLAHHFTEAAELNKGIQYWLQAGQRSQERSANTEAISHLRHGLELIATLPETPQRDGMELQFQIPLTVNLMSAKGYANPEVQTVQQRSRQLCEQIGEGAPLFHVLMGLWATNLILENLEYCLQLGDEIMAIAEASQDRGLLAEAHWGLVCTLLFYGDFERCRQHAEIGMEHFDLELSLFHQQFTSQNSGVCMLVYLALANWYLGYPDVAREKMVAAIELDEEVNHLFTRSVLLFHKAYLEQMLEEGEETQRTAARLLAHATEQGYPFFIAAGHLFQGAGLVLTGNCEEAIRSLESAHELFRMTGAEWGVSHLCCSLAEAHWKLGQLDEAFRAIEDGFQHAYEHKGLYVESILFRLKGECLLAASPDNHEDALKCFEKSVEVARGQKAKSLELRHSTRLARYLQQQGQPDKARPLLAEIHKWFTEGFDTPDLKEAEVLLQELDT